VSDPPLVPGPIYGLRTWVVTGAPGEERLTGPHRTTPWPSGGRPLEASCSAIPAHAPPGPTCGCGLHAWHPTRAAARRVCGLRREVPGILEAFGPVEVHADGFRAASGRPHALVLLPNGNARRLERLAEAYDAELLRLDGPDALLAHCRDRNLGLSPEVVAELVDMEGVAAARRARRRRGALAAVAVAAVALVLAVLAVAVDPGAEHGRKLGGRSGEIHVP
jgi:hypothetical protein